MEESERQEHHDITDTINEEIENTQYSRLLDEDGIFDEFAVNNLYNEERVKHYYTTPQKLNVAYESTDFFNVNFQSERRLNLEEIRLSMRQARSKKQKIKDLVKFLEELDSPALRQHLIEEIVEAATIIKAFDKLGSPFLRSVDYSLTKVEKKLSEVLSEEKRFCPEILQEIESAFILGEKKDKFFFKDKLQEIYSRYGIVQRVTQKTIADYFDITTDNGLSMITLQQFNPKSI